MSQAVVEAVERVEAPREERVTLKAEPAYLSGLWRIRTSSAQAEAGRMLLD